jgi:hypothetical protein
MSERSEVRVNASGATEGASMSERSEVMINAIGATEERR